MMESLHGHCIGLGEGTVEEMGLQAFSYTL